MSGSVLGFVNGFLPDTAFELGVHWTRIVDEDGGQLVAKIEGLSHGGRGGAGRMFATIDADDPDRPSELLEIALDGSWVMP